MEGSEAVAGGSLRKSTWYLKRDVQYAPTKIPIFWMLCIGENEVMKKYEKKWSKHISKTRMESLKAT
jgi:hypothetical protein